MIYLGECPAAHKRVALDGDYKAKCDALDIDYDVQRAPLDADYRAKRAPREAEVVAYIRAHIPDCAWDGSTLVFAPKGLK